MDPKTEKAVNALKEIRERKEIKFKPSSLLRPSIIHYGQEKPFQLRKYQIVGTLHLILMGRFLLGDDTGVGKTIQTISALCHLWETNPTKVIIVTNKSLVGQWGSEFHKFVLDGKIETFLCSGTPAKRKKTYERFKAHEGPCALILGYATVRQDYFEHLADLKGFTLVLDECTNIKSIGSRISQICRLFSAQASRCWGLTATLIKRDLVDGWGIYSVVYPGLFQEKTEDAFMRNFCVTREVDTFVKNGKPIKKRIIVGYRKDQIERFKEIIGPFFLSRSKELEEVASELPNLTIKCIDLKMTEAQEAKYEEALNGLLTLGSGEEKETTKLSRLAYCQQIVNHLELIECEGDSPKLDALIDLLTHGDLAGNKVVVFSRFRTMIDIIEKKLNDLKIKNVRITGDENEREREDAKALYSDPTSGFDVCLITEAAKEGANLQVSKALIFFDTPWTGGDFIQIIGRMVRMGALHQNVYAIHLVMQSTIDERTIEKLQTSMDIIQDVIGQRITTGEGGNDLLLRKKSDLDDLITAMLQDRKGK